MENVLAMEKRDETELNEHEQPESQVDWKSMWKPLCILIGTFAIIFWLPINNSRFAGAVIARASYSWRSGLSACSRRATACTVRGGPADAWPPG